MKIKYSKNKIREKSIWNTTEALLLLVMITGNIAFLPSIVNMLLLYAMLLSGIVAIVRKGKIRLNFLCNCFYFYSLFSIISLLLSPYFQVSLILSVGQYILITLVLINIPIERIKKVLTDYIKLLTGLVYVGIAYSFILRTFGDYMQYDGQRINYLLTPLIRQKTDGASWEIGHCAFWDNPNVFAFCILIVFVFKLCEEEKRTNKKVLNLLYLLLGSFLANSRGIYVCIVLSVAVYFYLRMKSDSKLLSILFVLIILAGFIATGVADTVVAGIDLTGRDKMWSAMLETIIEHPIFGVGFSVTSKYILGDILGRVVGSHNSYLNVLAENGIVGFVILIAIIVCVLYSIYLAKKRKNIYADNVESTWFTFSSVLFIAFLAYGMIENAFMVVGSRNCLWMILCIYIFSIVKRQNYNNENIIG